MAAWTTGAHLGPYLLLAPIGAGGMGEVWKARDTRLDRIVAVKRLNEQHSARFEQEARAIAALNHPHICQIHDIGPDYLVLEYVEGRPLKGPQSAEEAVRLAAQIAAALDAAHRKGVVHRDLKPANILVTSEGSVKLLDFGLAKQFADSDQTATIEGTVMGTAAYMAPEQAEGKPLDARSDVFSFGAVLYELLSGRQAFCGDNSISTMAAILHREPAPLDAPLALQQVVKRCLAKPPTERYQTAAELRAALESINGKLEQVQPSIAVLPFANMSRDADDEYFSDGLAEEIINALTQVSGLKVIARTSAFAFKGKNEDVRGIADALGVTNVLEGSVRRAGPRLRVTAQLIHAADGTHLWSQRYDREMTDIFAVQDDIAAAITEALKVKLTTAPAPARPHEPNLPAYEAYLKGGHYILKVDPDALARAEEYFKQAIALDPQWAEPHSTLALLYFARGILGLRPMGEVLPSARSEARMALGLLPSEPFAHAILGAIACLHDYDWNEAAERFRQTRTSTSLPPYVRGAYAFYYLVPLGRFEEAFEEYAQVIAQDPLNVLWRSNYAITLADAGMYERAIAEARKVLELDETNYRGNHVIAWCQTQQGNFKEALEPAEAAFRRAPWQPLVTGNLAAILSLSGEQERANQLLSNIGGGALSIDMLAYHLLLAQYDAAIDWYERAIEQRQPIAAHIASAVSLKPLRAHPRWPKLAKMMNLPVEVDR
ncbi:MAG TPA: protein kinase [Bryobacteraceae bacterium]|nr:protein kinase [Bryobacteraceae bacterium]